MSIIEERDAYLKNPFFTKHEYSDFSPFYISVAICTVIFALLLILNIYCCCSQHSDYWLNRHTGNRWLVSIWSATPHNQPPLDYTELEKGLQVTVIPARLPPPQKPTKDYYELHKRESDI